MPRDIIILLYKLCGGPRGVWGIGYGEWLNVIKCCANCRFLGWATRPLFKSLGLGCGIHLLISRKTVSRILDQLGWEIKTSAWVYLYKGKQLKSNYRGHITCCCNRRKVVPHMCFWCLAPVTNCSKWSCSRPKWSSLRFFFSLFNHFQTGVSAALISKSNCCTVFINFYWIFMAAGRRHRRIEFACWCMHTKPHQINKHKHKI